MIELTWTDVQTQTQKLLEKIKTNELTAAGKWIQPFDGIVGLTRGGLIPAVILSHNLGLPVKTLEFSSKAGAGDKHHTNQIPDWFKTGRWLVVDDIVDSGYTFKELAMQNNNSVFCCLFLRHSSCYRPKYEGMLLIGESWLCFPWEK